MRSAAAEVTRRRHSCRAHRGGCGLGRGRGDVQGDPARYLGEGGNFIDTASRYMEGASESVIGKYLAKNPGVRDRLVIASNSRSRWTGRPAQWWHQP